MSDDHHSIEGLMALVQTYANQEVLCVARSEDEAYWGLFRERERIGDGIRAYLEAMVQHAYAEGRKDEREGWQARIVPLLRELETSEYLSEQQCASLLDVGLVSWRTMRHEQEECPDCEGKGVIGEIYSSGDPFQPPEVQGCPTCGKAG